MFIFLVFFLLRITTIAFILSVIDLVIDKKEAVCFLVVLNMKVPSLLLVAAATGSFGAAIKTREESFSEQLLDTLGSFSSSDPIISELSAAIRNSSLILDQASSQNNAISVRTSSFQAQTACQLLRCILPDSYTDIRTNQTAYVTLLEKNWSVRCGTEKPGDPLC